MPVKSYRVSCMLMIEQCIFNQEDFPKINRSTSINMKLEKISTWIKLESTYSKCRKKTKYMIFHKRRKIDYLSLKLNNNEIANVNQFCFSGYNN